MPDEKVELTLLLEKSDMDSLDAILKYVNSALDCPGLVTREILVSQMIRKAVDSFQENTGT